MLFALTKTKVFATIDTEDDRRKKTVMQKLVVASGNKNKVKEIKALLGNRFEVVSMKEMGVFVDVEETGTTFEENALIKAKAVYELCGLPAVADDSGLIVDALNGEPGVYSARYAGEPCDDAKNNEKLLFNLKNEPNRAARFVSAVVLYDGKTAVTGFGTVEGSIIDEYRGTNGFGYDPLFLVTELNKTFGEASDEEKNSVSHRARALQSLTEKL